MITSLSWRTKHCVFLDVNHDVEIALRTAAVAGLALAAQLEAASRCRLPAESLPTMIHACGFGPVPGHFGHGSEMIIPSPRHCPHVSRSKRIPAEYGPDRAAAVGH